MTNASVAEKLLSRGNGNTKPKKRLIINKLPWFVIAPASLGMGRGVVYNRGGVLAV
jgi:hypothetical protein